MNTNLNTEQGAWDSESRLSPYATVWSPVQDDEAQWEQDYIDGLRIYGNAVQAAEYADSLA